MIDTIQVLRDIANRAGRPTMDYSPENVIREQRESLDWIAVKAAEAIKELAATLTISLGTGFAPPRCAAHNNEAMVLYIYNRPGIAPGNGWGCQSCAREQTPIPFVLCPHEKRGTRCEICARGEQ